MDEDETRPEALPQAPRTPQDPAKQAREARLAAALRDNLRRRKGRPADAG